MLQLNSIPLFDQLEDCQNILLAGAGGGFDIYCGIPLYFSLKEQGKNVLLANFSFTWLDKTTAKLVHPYCYEVGPGSRDLSGRDYFPEKHLSAWFATQGEYVMVYSFARTGIKPLKKAYQYLIDRFKIDAIVLVDGGTDSLMFGDEEGLGTPQEDVCSMSAVYQTSIKKQFLVCLGFGVDDYHGVSHFRFLENVATLSRVGGYLGAFTLLAEMEEAKKYKEALEYANKRMEKRESIVSNSIISALDGEYGDYHRTNRTRGSTLWINPLMTMYWAFDLRKLMPFNQYYPSIKQTKTIGELNHALIEYRRQLPSLRENKKLSI